MLGLAAIAALASLAFIGASSASAQSTTLCKTSALPCPVGSQFPTGTKIDGLTVGTSLLLTNLVTVHCHGSASGKITSAALANPLLGTLVPSFTKCATTGGTACTVTTTSGTLLLLKTAPGVGTATIDNVLATVVCGAFINCSYTSAGVKFEALSLKAGVPALLHANKVPLKNEGGFLCPATSELDALYEVWALNGAGGREEIHISS